MCMTLKPLLMVAIRQTGYSEVGGIVISVPALVDLGIPAEVKRLLGASGAIVNSLVIPDLEMSNDLHWRPRASGRSKARDWTCLRRFALSR